MLQWLTDRASRWFVYTIIILVSVPFALWGLNDYFNGGGKQVAAEVAGQSISIQAFAQAYRNEQLRLLQNFGGHLPPGLNQQTLKRAVLDRLVRDKVIYLAARKDGYTVTDLELADQLLSIPAFLVDGKFSRSRYDEILRTQDMTPGQFEDQIRHGLLIHQWEKGIESSTFITREELMQAARLLNERRKVSILPVSHLHYLSGIQPGNSEIAKYYNQHKRLFMTPELVKLDYIRLDKGTIRNQIHVTDTELKRFYVSHKNIFTVPARAGIREIVVNLYAVGAGRKRALIRLDEIKKDLETGASFIAVEQKFSQTHKSAQADKIRFVTRKDLPLALANAVFALKSGRMTPPIRVGNKVYIIRLVSIQPGLMAPAFKAIQRQVESTYIEMETHRLFNTAMQRLTNLAYEQPGSLAPIAQSLGLKIQTSPWISRSGGGGLWSEPKIIAAAFSNVVLKNKANSSLIQLGREDLIVLHAHKIKRPQPKSLVSVRPEIVSLLKQRGALEMAAHKAKILLALLQKGETTVSVAKAEHLVIENLGWISRGKQFGLPKDVIQTAFTISLPVNKTPVYRLIVLSSGEPAVMAVEGVRYPRMPKQQLQILQKRLISIWGRQELQVVYEALLKGDHVKIYPNNLNF